MRVLKDLLFIFGAIFGHLLMISGDILLVRLLAIGLDALCGWFIGLFIGDTVLGILSQIGISGFSMWQIGAFIGFIASFFIKITDIRTNKA